MKWVIGIVGFLIAIGGGVGLGQVTGDSFDFDNATLEERQAWLDEATGEISDGAALGLVQAGTGYNMMAVQEVSASAEDNRISIILEAKGATRLAIPADFSVQFMDKMCDEWVRTPMGRHGVLLTTKIVRSNGDHVRSETVSKPACDRYRDFKRRQS